MSDDGLTVETRTSPTIRNEEQQQQQLRVASSPHRRRELWTLNCEMDVEVAQMHSI